MLRNTRILLPLALGALVLVTGTRPLSAADDDDDDWRPWKRRGRVWVEVLPGPQAIVAPEPVLPRPAAGPPRTAARTATFLLGAAVKGENGELLGRVEDLVFAEPGYIDFAFVSFNGLPGLSGKLVAVPWSVAAFDHQRRFLSIGVPRHRLAHAPSFTRDNLPDVADPRWREMVYAFWGIDLEPSDREAEPRSRERESDSDYRQRSDRRAYRDEPPAPRPSERVTRESRNATERRPEPEDEEEPSDDRPPTTRESTPKSQGNLPE